MKTDAERIAELERKQEQMARRLDEVLRNCGLAPFIDEQLLAINARKEALARGQAA